MKPRVVVVAAANLALLACLSNPTDAPAADGSPPAPMLRLEARDEGRVLRHGDGPGQCDVNGAREASVFEFEGTYYLHYDGCGPKGWLACLATSKDLKTWTKRGPVLDFGAPGEDDSGTATSPWVIREGKSWHMFYVGSPNTTPAPDFIPAIPYLTMKARADSPAGPWTKQKDVTPFRPSDLGPGYGPKMVVASPGMVIKSGEEYLMFFSWGGYKPVGTGPFGNIGLARTRDLDGKWTLDPKPLLPGDEVCENSSLYHEPRNDTWFLFSNHIDPALGCTDSIWVHWSRDLTRWDPAHKAVVLDGRNCPWSKKCIGMPTVIPVGDRLALLYDAPGGDDVGHMNRDIGLAWLDLPLMPPPGAAPAPAPAPAPGGPSR